MSLSMTPQEGMGSLRKICFYIYRDKINSNNNQWIFEIIEAIIVELIDSWQRKKGLGNKISIIIENYF